MRARLRRRMAVQVQRGAQALATRCGLDTVGHSVYSPVPVIPPPDAELWRHRAPLHGIDFDVDAQLRLVEQLRPHLEEFGPELVERRGFDVWNEYYKAGDAELLYALVRHLKPARILELGSGFSTHVSAAAAVMNAAEGAATELTTVDPEPRTSVAGLEGVSRVERGSAMDVPLERFQALEDGDILFVDTSHTVKLGSEVNWLVLEVLPLLQPGVYVHFHDVFLPYEYPRYLFEHVGYFAEQYLVQAFLTANSSFEIVLGACALARERREQMIDLIPSLAESIPGLEHVPYVPAAFWIRRRPAG